MVTDEQISDLVKRIVEAVAPVRIILFGPAARGEARPQSDVDVLVVVREGVHRRRSAQLIYRHLLGFGVPVNVVVATPSDLELYRDSKGLVYREAIREGRELYAGMIGQSRCAVEMAQQCSRRPRDGTYRPACRATYERSFSVPASIFLSHTICKDNRAFGAARCV